MLRGAEAYCFSPKESEKKRRAKLHEERTTPLSRGNVPGSNRKRRVDHPTQENYTVSSNRRAIYRAWELAFDMPAELREIPVSDAEAEFGRSPPHNCRLVVTGHRTSEAILHHK